MCNVKIVTEVNKLKYTKTPTERSRMSAIENPVAVMRRRLQKSQWTQKEVKILNQYTEYYLYKKQK